MRSVGGVAVGSGLAAGSASAHVHSSGSSLVDAVIKAFRTHRLVGLGERHGLQEHHDALQRLLTDARIAGVVDDIVIEFGNSLYQSTIDRFIAGKPVDDADLRVVWRNTTQSPVETWDEPVYEQFFRTVRAINWTRPKDQRVRVLAGDPPINWAKIHTRTQVLRYLNARDTHAASVVRTQVLAKGRRALICYGSWHLLRVGSGLGGPNLVSLLQSQTGTRTHTIIDLVPSAGDPGGLARRLADRQRDAVIPTANTWLGSFDTGFIPPSLTPGRPSPWCGVMLGSLIDAGIYLGPPSVLTASSWNPAIFLDPAYWAELQRRNILQGNPVNLNTYRQDQPARLTLRTIPRSSRCTA